MTLLTFLADNGYVPERDDDDDDDVAYCSEPLTRETVTVEHYEDFKRFCCEWESKA